MSKSTLQSRSLSGLADRSEGKSVLRQFLSDFAANSGSIKQESAQKMATLYPREAAFPHDCMDAGGRAKQDARAE
jgi:hypothetical protein